MGIIQHQHETQASSELKEIHLEEKLKSIRGVVSGVMGCILNICKKFAECVYGGVMGQAPAKQTNERRDNLATTGCSSDPVTGLAAWVLSSEGMCSLCSHSQPCTLHQLTVLGCLSGVRTGPHLTMADVSGQ